MGIDIKQGKTKVLRFIPSAPMASPTCSITSRIGTVLASPTATAHPLATTVLDDDANTPTYVKLQSVTALSVGDTVQFIDTLFGKADAVIASISGLFVRLIEALPETPSEDASVTGLDITCTVPVEATATLSMDNVALVTDGTDELVELFNVVAHVYDGPISAPDVRDHIARLYGGEYAGNSIGDNDWQWHARVADEVNRNLRGRLLESSAFVSRFWDPDALLESGRIMLRLVLADKGYWTGDGDREDQLRSLRLELKERIGGILAGAQAYDADNDGEIDDAELDGSTTIRGLR